MRIEDLIELISIEPDSYLRILNIFRAEKELRLKKKAPYEKRLKKKIA
jgi:hypothetical protein